MKKGGKVQARILPEKKDKEWEITGNMSNQPRGTRRTRDLAAAGVDLHLPETENNPTLDRNFGQLPLTNYWLFVLINFIFLNYLFNFQLPRFCHERNSFV